MLTASAPLSGRGADAIVCGAGLPKDLPALASEVSDSDAAIAPIVSSGRAAGLLCKLWDRHYGRIPDFLILEGPEAGGHLGFSRQDLDAPPSLSDLLREVLTALAPFRDKAGRDIPVFVAGGVKNGADMARYMKEGAARGAVCHPVHCHGGVRRFRGLQAAALSGKGRRHHPGEKSRGDAGTGAAQPSHPAGGGRHPAASGAVREVHRHL